METKSKYTKTAGTNVFLQGKKKNIRVSDYPFHCVCTLMLYYSHRTAGGRRGLTVALVTT